tara:strand:- start:152 stop:574 length:423 start_codon:yes stop_codon:yes gene_type:complete
MKVIVVDFEQLVFLDMETNIQIASHTIFANRPLPYDPKHYAMSNTWSYLKVCIAHRLNVPVSFAFRALFASLGNATGSVAIRTQASHGEALERLIYRTLAVARLAVLRLSPLFSSRALALLTDINTAIPDPNGTAVNDIL